MKRWVFLIVSGFLVQTTLLAQECLVYDYSGEAYPYEHTEVYQNQKFSVQIPQGWPKDFDTMPYRTDQGSVSGVEVSGPEREGVKTKMIFAYYPPEGMFQNYQGYVNLRTNSFVRTNPEKSVALRKIKVDGKKAVAFEMETFELVYEQTFRTIDPEPGVMYKMGYDERLVPTKKVIIHNKEIIVPLKQGFFVARFDLPKTLVRECAPMLKAVIGSIKLEGENDR